MFFFFLNNTGFEGNSDIAVSQNIRTVNWKDKLREYLKVVKSKKYNYPRNRPWRPIGL
jgi:hypothetical protein